MSRQISHFKLGVFILVCGAIGIGALLWIGAVQFFHSAETYAVFFNASVGGLQKGAPVKYLGVSVGRVGSISLAPDGRLVMVLMDLRQDFKVRKDLAVELTQEGITGQRYLALVKAPPNIQELTPTINFPVKYPVIQSRSGEITEIENALRTLYSQVKSMDLGGLVEEWKNAGAGINRIMADKDIRQTLRNLKEVTADLQDLLGPLSKARTENQWKQSLDNLAATVAAARKAVEALETRLTAIPPHEFADISERMDQLLKTGETRINRVDKEINQSLALFRETIFNANQLISEMKGLVQSLREEPGRIFSRPEGSEPFQQQK
jgi:ABC-type transporter Mla subunit MlaD